MTEYQTLLNEAAHALVVWRRIWERDSCSPPLAENGQTREERRLWKIAGKLMEANGFNRELPG